MQSLHGADCNISDRLSTSRWQQALKLVSSVNIVEVNVGIYYLTTRVIMQLVCSSELSNIH